MKTRRLLLALAAGGLVLTITGCDASDERGGDVAAPVTPTEKSASPAPTASASRTAPDALAACGIFADGGDDSLLSRVPEVLLSVGPSTGPEEVAELLDINARLAEAVEVAPAALAAALTSVKVPFQQAQEVVDSGGGGLTMNTGSMLADVTKVLELCVDAGYRVDG